MVFGGEGQDFKNKAHTHVCGKRKENKRIKERRKNERIKGRRNCNGGKRKRKRGRGEGEETFVD